MGKKQQVRAKFRDAVFGRSKNRCEGTVAVKHCSKAAVDAHHITPREKMPGGGYVKENGIALCEDCHLDAEANIASEFHRNKLYERIGSSYDRAVRASVEQLT